VSALRAEPSAPANGRLTVDRLEHRHDPVEVVLFDALEVEGEAREPHRHDYHELIYTRAGSGQHLLDNRTVAVVPGTMTVIGRGQVHRLRACARRLRCGPYASATSSRTRARSPAPTRPGRSPAAAAGR